VVVVFSKPLGLVEFWSSRVYTGGGLLFCLLFLGKQRTSGTGLWRTAGVWGFLVETLFKARSCKLGWFIFNMNPPIAVFDPLRSRWMPYETVWCVPVRYVTYTRRGFLFLLSRMWVTACFSSFGRCRSGIWKVGYCWGAPREGEYSTSAGFGGFFPEPVFLDFLFVCCLYVFILIHSLPIW
jgi:hypothetical protein